MLMGGNMSSTSLRLRTLFFLFLYSILFIIVLYFYGYLNIQATYDVAEKTRSEMIEAQAINAVNNLDNEIDGIKAFSSAIADIYLNNRSLFLEGISNNIFKENQQLIGITLTRNNKIELSIPNNVPQSEFEKQIERLLANERFSNVVDQQIIFDSESYKGTKDILEVVSLIPLNNGGKLITIYRINNNFLWIKNGTRNVIDKYYIFSLFDKRILPSEILLIDTNILITEMAKGSTLGSITIDSNNKKNLVVYIFSPKYSYYLFNNVPLSYLKEYPNTFIGLRLLLAIAACILILAIYFIFNQTILKPIFLNIDAIQGILQGEFEKPININPKNRFHSIAMTINKMILKIREISDREHNMSMQKKQAELIALQSQINPHFLYNTLESIRGQAIKEKAPNVANMTKALSNLFRYSISNKDSLVPLREELKNIDNYLTIQQYRFKNKFNVNKEYGENEKEIMEYIIPKLTIQPIIENAIHHGLETKVGRGNITIKIVTTQKRLIINVIDDGKGIEPEKLEELNFKLLGKVDIAGYKKSGNSSYGSGIALVNANERIKLFFGNEYGIRVYSAEGIGTDIEILLPLVNNTQDFNLILNEK